MDQALAKEIDPPRRAAWLGLAVASVLGLAVVASFWPSVMVLVDRWERDSNYSHGWLIVPIAAAILWQRRERLPAIRPEPRWWGLGPLVGLLALRVYLFQKNEQWAEQALIPAIVGSIVLAIGGWSFFWWALPGVLFLCFMIPLPMNLNDQLAGPLQSLATWGSAEILEILQQPVIREGNVIIIGDQTLEVAEACRGLSMLLSFAALITAMVILIRRPLWERIVLVASIIPIALLCNVVRISVTAIVYTIFHRKVETAHDYAGYAMMVLALGLVTLEMKVMSWLVIEEVAPSDDAKRLYRPAYGPPARPR